jgi:MFS family permease
MMIALHRLTDSFRHSDYRRYWLGSMITIVTYRISDVVLGWQMLEVSDSAFLVGMVGFAQGLPLLVFSPISGLMADRIERRRIMVMALVLASASAAALAVLAALGTVVPWHIVLISFLLGSAFTLYAPARLALLPALVPDGLFLSASTVEYSSTRLMGFFGPLLAGVLLSAFGAPFALMTMVLLFIAAAGTFARTGTEPHAAVQIVTHQRNVVRGLGEAASYLRRDRPLLALTLLGLVMVPIGMSYQKLMPVFARDVLEAGPSTLGLMLALTNLGIAVAGFILAGIGGSFRKGYVVLLSSSMFALGLVIFAFARQMLWALSLLFMLGLFAGAYLTLSQVTFQSRPPNELRGRVMSAWGIAWGLLSFSSLAAGAVAETWSVTFAIAVGGTICLLFSVGMSLTVSQLRAL